MGPIAIIPARISRAQEHPDSTGHVTSPRGLRLPSAGSARMTLVYPRRIPTAPLRRESATSTATTPKTWLLRVRWVHRRQRVVHHLQRRQKMTAAHSSELRRRRRRSHQWIVRRRIESPAWNRTTEWERPRAMGSVAASASVLFHVKRLGLTTPLDNLRQGRDH